MITKQEHVKISKRHITIITISIAAIVTMSLVSLIEKNWSEIAFAILTGLTCGLILALLHMLLTWQERSNQDRLEGLGIKNVVRRETREYYGQIIENAEHSVDVMGTSASRFMQDFSDERSHRPFGNALIKAIRRGCRVRILLPQPRWITEDEAKKQEQTLRMHEQLPSEIQSKIEIKWYREPPRHTIVIADNEIIPGPQFPNEQSQHLPAVHTTINSIYGKPYKKFFEHTWSNASGDREISNKN